MTTTTTNGSPTTTLAAEEIPAKTPQTVIIRSFRFYLDNDKASDRHVIEEDADEETVKFKLAAIESKLEKLQQNKTRSQVEPFETVPQGLDSAVQSLQTDDKKETSLQQA